MDAFSNLWSGLVDVDFVEETDGEVLNSRLVVFPTKICKEFFPVCEFHGHVFFAALCRNLSSFAICVEFIDLPKTCMQ